MKSRFEFIKYDHLSIEQNLTLKEIFIHAESFIDSLADGRAKELALTAFEEAFMWCGKSIRDAQIKREEAQW